MLNAEQVRDTSELLLLSGYSGKPRSIKQIPAHAQMREKAAFLKDGPKLTPVGRQEYPAIRVEEGSAIDDDAPALGPQQPRNGVEERGFS
jgi:hypothetical protein